MAELLLKLRDREISRTPIKHMRIVIGRDATCDVVIDNAGVSRNHAVVLFDEGEFRIRDTESQNGITVNGKRVNETTLNYGDVIGVGKFELQLIETADEVELMAGTAAKAEKPRNVMSTMQMDSAAAARMRDEILAAKKKTSRAKPADPAAAAPAAAATPKAAAPAGARPNPARAKPKPEAGGRPKPAARRPAPEPAEPTPLPAPAWKRPAAIAAALLVPAALAALWLMRG